MKYLTLAGFVAVFPAAAAAKPIFPIVQEREIQASLDLSSPEMTDGQTAAAPDMQPWVEGVEAVIAEPDYFEVTAAASQYSEIGESILSAYGTVVFDAAVFPPGVEGLARVESRYRVQFAVATPVTFNVAGFISALAGAAGDPCCQWTIEPSVSVRLDQVAGPVILDEQVIFVFGEFVQDAELADSLPLDAHGELAPGVYELQVTASVSVPQFVLEDGLEHPARLYGEDSYVVDMVFAPAGPDPVCAGMDANGDGSIDLMDYAWFQECFTGPGE